MMFLWLPFLFLVPFAIFWLLRPGAIMGGCGVMNTMPEQPSSVSSEDLKDIVRSRLARGEITTTEFDEILRALSN